MIILDTKNSTTDDEYAFGSQQWEYNSDIVQGWWGKVRRLADGTYQVTSCNCHSLPAKELFSFLSNVHQLTLAGGL